MSVAGVWYRDNGFHEVEPTNPTSPKKLERYSELLGEFMQYRPGVVILDYAYNTAATTALHEVILKGTIVW